MTDYVAPEFRGDAFHCPHCGTYAHQRWQELYYQRKPGFSPTSAWRAVCNRCHQDSYWHEDEEAMVYPRFSTAPPPSRDMPEHAAVFYNEARDVLDVSPRAAAALLRSCIEQLLIDLGYEQGNLNAKIGALVDDGLPERFQKMFDAVRITGNSIHPGQIADDNRDMALSMFQLVNRIVDERITQLNKEEEIWEMLPDGAKEAVDRRDGRPTEAD